MQLLILLISCLHAPQTQRRQAAVPVPTALRRRPGRTRREKAILPRVALQTGARGIATQRVLCFNQAASKIVYKQHSAETFAFKSY